MSPTGCSRAAGYTTSTSARSSHTPVSTRRHWLRTSRPRMSSCSRCWTPWAALDGGVRGDRSEAARHDTGGSVAGDLRRVRSMVPPGRLQRVHLHQHPARDGLGPPARSSLCRPSRKHPKHRGHAGQGSRARQTGPVRPVLAHLDEGIDHLGRRGRLRVGPVGERVGTIAHSTASAQTRRNLFDRRFAGVPLGSTGDESAGAVRQSSAPVAHDRRNRAQSRARRGVAMSNHPSRRPRRLCRPPRRPRPRASCWCR